MLEMILRNILLQLETIEVHGRENVRAMNNVMDNLQELIKVTKGSKEEAKDEDHAEHGKDI